MTDGPQLPSRSRMKKREEMMESLSNDLLAYEYADNLPEISVDGITVACKKEADDIGLKKIVAHSNVALRKDLMAKNFKVSLSLRKRENGDAVYHKQDGERFETPHTVKLNINTEYDVHIEIRPPLNLQMYAYKSYEGSESFLKPQVTQDKAGSHPFVFVDVDVLIHGERMEPKMDTKKTKDDDSVYAYNLCFNTMNYDLIKRGTRKLIPFVLELEKGLTLSIKLQCKLYKEHETEHCKWGQELTMLEYECHVPESQTFVDVIREKYL